MDEARPLKTTCSHFPLSPPPPPSWSIPSHHLVLSTKLIKKIGHPNEFLNLFMVVN